MSEIPGRPDEFEIAKADLQASVLADGGLMGLFHALRGDDGLAFVDRYGRLLQAATSPGDRTHRQEARAAKGVTAGEWFSEQLLEVSGVDGVDLVDVPALFMALAICTTAFPGILPDQIGAGGED